MWTSPTGHTYTTYPGSRHLFPKLCEPTGTLWTGDPPVVESTGDRGVMMPKRRHTRAQITTNAIAAERRLNDAFAAERIAQRTSLHPSSDLRVFAITLTRIRVKECGFANCVRQLSDVRARR